MLLLTDDGHGVSHIQVRNRVSNGVAHDVRLLLVSRWPDLSSCAQPIGQLSSKQSNEKITKNGDMATMSNKTKTPFRIRVPETTGHWAASERGLYS